NRNRKKLQNPKTIKSRQKIEIKEIKKENRRQRLLRALIGIITFSHCDRVYSFGSMDTLIEKYLRKAPVTLRSQYNSDDVATGGGEENGSMCWEKAVESVPEEDMEEICELGGDPTVQMNALAFPSLMAPVDWKIMDENLTIRIDQDEAGNGGYVDFAVILFLSQNRRQ
ncbi:hypothetical protein HID58_047271, partial [Brassica napus]